MLTVTEDAKAHLATLLEQNEAPDGTAVRLVVAQEGLALAPDTPNDEDETFEHSGKTVLVVKPSIAEQLDGRTLEMHEGDNGTELRMS